MNFSREDIEFSLRKYLAAMLGQPWVINFERTEIRNDERPLGYIDFGPSRTTFARETVPQGDVSREATVTVNLYPAVGRTPRAGSREADQVAQLLHDLVDFGLDLGHGQNGRPIAGPYRFPVYDYADTSVAPALPYGTVKINPNPAVRKLQDPLDSKRWAVVADLTLAWDMPGRVLGAADSGPVVQSVPGEWVPPGGVVPAPLPLSPAHARASGRLDLTT